MSNTVCIVTTFKCFRTENIEINRNISHKSFILKYLVLAEIIVLKLRML